MAGINIYEARKNPSFSAKGLSDRDNPCVFLSHINVDKTAVLKIADFIKNSSGIDIYLDIEDTELQQAVRVNNHAKITECIDKGIDLSTHVLCLVSEQTKNSWWVPYEIGYAKKGKKNIGTMKLKHTTSLPSFLSISPILSKWNDLQSFLKPLIGTRSFVSLSDTHGYINPVYKPLFEHFELTQR